MRSTLPRGAHLLLVALVLAGCIQAADDSGPAPPASAPAAPVVAAEILATLELGARPDAKRALADLERFVDAAPRRYDNQFEHGKARDWLIKEYEALGLEVTRHKFTGAAQAPGSPPVEGQNIIATLPGRQAHHVILFGGHYDGAVSGYGAAYDDGSGTVITLALARALSQYEWNHTLVFASWDQEEAGLVGSRAYVKDLVEQDIEVRQAVNFDMAGINWPAKVGTQLPTPVKATFGGPAQKQFVELWAAVDAHLQFPAEATDANTGASATSDHGSFIEQDLPAVWVRGALIGSYPMYHNADTVPSMLAAVGGNRADLEAGFDTVLQSVFLLAFLADQVPPVYEE